MDMMTEDVQPAVVEEDAARDQKETAVDWREKALRLQAEMDNYRKRQRKLAQDQVVQEKMQLMLKFLEVLDSMEKILSHLRPDDVYDQGLRVMYDQMCKLVKSEGVARIPTAGVPFDPKWHDAVAMVPASADQDVDMLVIDEELPGYRIGEHLLRPARVVVAKQ